MNEFESVNITSKATVSQPRRQFNSTSGRILQKISKTDRLFVETFPDYPFPLISYSLHYGQRDQPAYSGLYK